MGEAAFKLEQEEHEDYEDLDDSWYEGEIWRKPEDVIPQEEPIIMARAAKALPDIPKVLPSQFARFAFRFPTDDEDGLGADGSGYDKFSFEGRRHMVRLYDTPAKRILLCCGRQVEKCVSQVATGYEFVYTALGMPIPAFDVQVGQSLISWDEETQRVCSSRVVAKKEVGSKSCVQIWTRQGHAIRVADTHPILTPQGWVAPEEISVGTRVGVIRRGGMFGRKAPDPYWVTLLAYFIADGNLGTSGDQLSFSKREGVVAQDFLCCVEMVDPDAEVRNYQKPGSFGVARHVRNADELITRLSENQLWGCCSKDKFIPDEVFDYSRKNTALFLNRLWACDGSVKKETETKYSIEYASISLKLIRQVQSLLWKFGIPTSYRRYQPKIYEGTGKYSHILRVETRRGVRRFLEEIGALGKSEGVPLPDESIPERNNRDTIPAELVRRYVETALPVGISLRQAGIERFPRMGVTQDRVRTLVDLLLGAGAKKKDVRLLKSLLDSDLYWDEVESIEDVGKEPCFDIEVERTHNFLLNGVFTHNSTLLSNRAICYMSMVHAFRVLYVSASATQAKKFSNDRIREPVETSPVLRRFTTKMLSSNILEKQFVNRSQITMRYAFLNADRTRGIPADMLCIDEFQDILGDNIPVIEQCLSHGRAHWKMYLYAGTPKSLDNNLETYWSSYSTQNEWVVPHDCKGGEGGRYWNECLGEKNIGKRGLICANCGTLINPMTEQAQWAMTGSPDAMFEGYRIPQLMVPWIDWKTDVVLNYERYARDKFYNEVLGLSYDSGLRPLTRTQVRECCNPELTMREVEHYRQLAYGQSIYAGIDWGCHDESTRILTEGGFKYFEDLTDDDKVAQWDPGTRKMTFVKPKVRTVRDWEQPLLHFKTKGGMDLMVTHTHRMRVGRMQGKSWVTESAEDTALRGGPVHFVGWVKWDGEDVKTFELPGLPTSPGYQGCEPRTFDMDGWVEFLGYMLTEGGVCLKKNSKDEFVPYCLKMSQRQTVNPKNYERIRNCMESLGIPFTEFPNPETGDANWAIYGKQLWDWFSKNMGMTGDTKRIPRQFLKLSRYQLQILFDAMVLGDGYVDPRENCTGGAYYSTSRGLCEDFQEICIKLGMRCSVGLHKPAEGNRKARYRALWSVGRDYHLNTPSRKVKKVPYKGKVYCCAVPTGYIVTERNGKVAYQGNTGENSYTVIVLATYIDMKFRVFFAHRFTGEEVDPEIQITRIKELLHYFNVKFIGCDYGGGYDRNHYLVREFGPKRVWSFQHLGKTRTKVMYDSKMGRFKVSRSEVMGDFFNAIKRKQCEFPRWEEWEDPFAQDMLNIFAEFNETNRMLDYKHKMDKPDDTFHSFMYAWLASMLEHPRADIVTPNREEDGRPVNQYRGPVDQ